MAKRSVFCFFAMGLALLACAGNGFAGNKNQLDQVQSDINSVTQKMQRIKEQRDAMQNLLAEVEQRYGETASVLRTLQQQVDEKRESLEKIPLEIRKLEEEIAQCNKELAEQVRAAYAVGQKARLKLMLSQQDPASSSRIMVYYDYFNKARLAKLAFVEASVKRLDLLSQQKQKDTEFLEKSLAQKKVEQETLDRTWKERNALLLQLNNDFSSNEQRLARLKESENNLMELVDSLDIEEDDLVFEGDQAAENSAEVLMPSEEEPTAATEFSRVAGDFSKLKGKLPLPVAGHLASTFGSQRLQGVSNGILITANEGTDVRAVTKGRVVYAGNLQGYGLLMIVEHGEEFMTLYAFNQSLYKKKGDWVDAGEVIASVGQSGGRSQPGLYFEIRKQGKPIDPLAWCH
jgi:septal ring factor EnvC (AmiA/AmiB activator)